MDTTEKNIMMCEKAEEIQKLWEPKRGDIVYDVADNKNIWRSRDWHIITTSFTLREGNRFHIDMYQDICEKEEYIWLPTQDQLQKQTGIESIPTLLSQFNEFVFGNVGYTTQEMCNFIDSCEKLWLAFVMKKKYKKIWNGKEWVKK